MKFLRAITAVAALGALDLAGCMRSSCCPTEGGPIHAPQPSLRTEVAAQDQRGQVLLQVAFLRVPAAVASRVPKTAPVMSGADAADFQKRLCAENGVEILHQPAILTEAGQEATLFVGETYRMEGQTESSTGYDIDRPNWAGQRMRAVVTPSPDGSRLDLDFSFALRDLLPKGSQPDFAALAASGVRGSGVTNLKSGENFLIVVPAGPKAPNDRVFVFVEGRVVKGQT